MAGEQIVLLSCVKSKRSYPCRAGDMYISPLFQKMMAYARRVQSKKNLHPVGKVRPLESRRHDRALRADAEKYEGGRKAAMGA